MLASSPAVYRSCTSTSLRRGFTSLSIIQQEIQIPPQSPRYVDFPKPPQPDEPRQERVRGFLPVPRNIFKSRGRIDKTSKDFRDAATKGPARVVPKTSERLQYKQRLSEARRRNLRQGLEELSLRRNASDEASEERRRKRREDRQMLLEGPAADDERLTSDTVDKNLRDFLYKRQAVPRRRLGRYTADSVPTKAMDSKVQEQKDALHTLYNHARDFITDEAELAVAIDKTFDPEHQPDRNTRSIWAWNGKPLDLDQMMDRSTKGGGQSWAIAQARLTKVAEKLTGGKI